METKQDGRVWEQIINNSLDIIGTINGEGIFVNINEACNSILGYRSEEIKGHHFSNFVYLDDLESTIEIIQNIICGTKVKNFKNRCVHKNGREVLLLWSAAWSEEDEAILIVGRDITEQEQARYKEELHRALVEHGSDMLALLDEKLNFIYSEGSTLKELGYLPAQLIGRNALDFIHPDDVPLVQAVLSASLLSEAKIDIPEYRFKDGGGGWRWLETRGSNQLSNPAVKALVANSRDITDKVNTRIKLQESEQRFKSLFEHHLDIVLFQNKEGVIIDVNLATLSFFGVQKQDIINRPFTDFVPPEVVPVCEKSLLSSLNGEPVRLEIAIPFEGKGVVTFDAVKIPVLVNGEAIGVYTILKDVTEISLSHRTIKRQAEKLSTIFESITDAFFTLDRNWNFTYINQEFDKLLFTSREQLIGKSIWKAFPEEVNGEFFRQYFHAVEAGKAVHFEAFFEKGGIWLQVKAFPSEEGLSVYFTDITESVKSKQELEKLSLVASKTTNGVVIHDAEGRVEWVNEGFTRLLGYTLSDMIGKVPGSLLEGEETDRETGNRIREGLRNGKPFSEEIGIYKKSGEKVWVLLDFTPILNDAGEVEKVIAIQTDVTFRKEAEASQLQLTKDLFRQNRDLQQFTYIVSHNLRTPVANTMGLADLLSNVDKDSDLFDESLTYLKGSIYQIDAVLKDLNMILSVRDKRDTFEKEQVQLALVCQQAIANFQESLKECGGEVEVKMEESIQVRASKAYLYSIFYNLLSNAIKYRSPDRPLRVKIQCSVCTIRGTVISFSDNGTGFDMELAGDNLFKLYKRFHTRQEGRGIGLYLVKTHLEAMGGHIEVHSEVNVGTRFQIYLK